MFYVLLQDIQNLYAKTDLWTFKRTFEIDTQNTFRCSSLSCFALNKRKQSTTIKIEFVTTNNNFEVNCYTIWQIKKLFNA